MGPKRRLLAIALVWFLNGSGRARASYSINPAPDYQAGIRFRIGFTSEGRFSLGLSGDLIPVSAGIEFSPGSPRGVVRVFTVAKYGLAWPQSCSVFWGGSVGAVATFGPGQPLHFGLRLGAHIEHTPLANAATPVLAFPQVGEGVSYRFSWLPAVGVIHDGGADFGLYWAPHGYCQSD